MAIVRDDSTGLITISTQNTSYQMKIDSIGSLIHTHYGAPIGESDMSPQLFRMIRGFSSNPNETGFIDRAYSLDVLPQEYSCFGTGDYRITSLAVRYENGAKASRLKVQDCEILPGKYGIEGLPAVYGDDNEAQTLKVTLKDEETDLGVELFYGVFSDYDVITRSARIINNSDTTITLEKAASLNFDLPSGSWDWITFYGRHAQERCLSRASVRHGIEAIGSVRGISSHHYNPFSVLCEPTATETAGSCYGFALVYSGEHLMEVERDSIDQTRLVCGIHPDNFSWILKPGESFNTPEVIMTYSHDGLGQMSRNFHRIMRERLCRGPWKHRRRPVLINNWEATYFDFTGQKLLEIADEAESLGIELFVLDDGWFGVRNDDDKGLGDWFPNEEKLGMTMQELTRKITDKGLLFGIWFEPEAISEDSDLYRAHPDWAISIPGRKPAIDRRQLVLDYTREDVRDYIKTCLLKMLDENPISYIKWDMNRSISDKFSHGLDAKHQGEFAHRFVCGLYDVLETIYERHPEVLIEGCSGGGGRFDAGMLYYTPQIWTSDNTDAYDRLRIQYGTSFGYPLSAMGAHVSAVPNHQTGRVVPMHTRGVVAMAGTFGYELDITKLDEGDKAEIREQIKTFHRYYDLIQYGEYYRLSAPEDYCTVWEVAAIDKKEALVSAVYHGIPAYPPAVRVPVFGLDPAANYQIDILDLDEKYAKDYEKLTWQSTHIINGIVMSGAALEHGGITVPPPFFDGIAWQIFIHRLED